MSAVRVIVPIAQLREWTREANILEDVRREMSFAEMRDTVADVIGILELMRATVDAFGNGHTDCLDWFRISDCLASARKRLDPVYAAANRLELIDRVEHKTD